MNDHRPQNRSYSLCSSMHPESYTRTCPRNIDFYLMPYLLVESFPVAGKRHFDKGLVLLTFSR